eukprot:CAMPEP_0116917466 /NCGR_PEP_ID=MMETSP0467-20121206/19161_1 /TAXON_ID=283647 /ORGANISM="Mesodinium pulex, Strain SPMC105" /LENGTH=283 /DNA_ID=CAMNT_0004594567 /DNA_START=200 /DNA_END=1051 /DNA_ORIENTATION=-
MGIEQLTIIDNDSIDITNLNRQLIALDSNVSQCKVDVCRDRILAINPSAKVTAHHTFVTEANIPTLIPKAEFDVVFDCIDTILSKIALVAYCVQNKIKVLSSGGAGNKIDPSLIQVKDIKHTNSCKLIKYLREGLIKHKIFTGVKCVFSTEFALEPKRKGYNKGHGRPVNGTISYLPNMFGFHLFSTWASYKIKKLRESLKDNISKEMGLSNLSINDLKSSKNDLNKINYAVSETDKTKNKSLKRKRIEGDDGEKECFECVIRYVEKDKIESLQTIVREEIDK